MSAWIADVLRRHSLRSGTAKGIALLGAGAVFIIAALCVTWVVHDPEPKPLFDLRNPPEGWHRTIDPLSGVILWLPADWGMFTTPEGVDYDRETTYQRYGQPSVAIIMVHRIRSVDFARDPRDPWIWQTGGRILYPQSTFTMTVERQAIPCARYEVPSGRTATYVCVVPNSPNSNHAWAIYFGVEIAEEQKLRPIWQTVVASFVMEEQPK